MIPEILYSQCTIVECSYVFGLTAQAGPEYWEIFLKETDETRAFVKKHLWYKEPESLRVELSLNGKNAIIKFPDGVVRTVAINPDKPPERTTDAKISRINETREQRKNRAKLHELLNKLGIRFEIDFCKYKEDADYMTVFIDDKEVFSGITEDLKPPKESSDE